VTGQHRGETPRLSLSAFGLSLLADTPPPGAWETHPWREPGLQLRRSTAQAIEESWSGPATIGWEGFIDGAPFVVERGVQGDHRFVHGDRPDRGGAPSAQTRAIHHLSADASVLQCAPCGSADPSWWRLVLDSVLFTVAQVQGYEALHAAALATPEGTIAITASTGGGKSTLLAEMLGRGPALMADDVLILESRGAESPVLAHPAPPLMTLPSASIASFGEAQPLQTICSIEDERWIAFPVHQAPLPLKAIVVLDRRQEPTRPGPQPSLTKIEKPLAALMASMLKFPRTPERERARFEIASTIASTAGLWRLTADPQTPPDVLADTLMAVEL
jgi:hypothetical protein